MAATSDCKARAACSRHPPAPCGRALNPSARRPSGSCTAGLAAEAAAPATPARVVEQRAKETEEQHQADSERLAGVRAMAAGRPVDWLVGWLAGWVAGCLAACLAACLAVSRIESEHVRICLSSEVSCLLCTSQLGCVCSAPQGSAWPWCLPAVVPNCFAPAVAMLLE